MAPAKPFLTVDESAVLLANATQVMNALEAACIDQRGQHEPLPRGMLTCGEACLLIPAVVSLVASIYPELLEDGVLENALRNAGLNCATGGLN